MQGSTVVKVFAAVAVLVFISAIALMVYRSSGAALNWQMGDDDPIMKFYPGGDGLYVIGSSNISMVNETGIVQWTAPFANTQYSAAGNDDSIYVYSIDGGLNHIYPDGTVTLLTRQGMNHPPIVGADGTLYLRSWSVLSAMSPSGEEKWNVSNVVSDPVTDDLGNIYFFMRPPEHISDVYLYCMAPDGRVRWSIYYEKYLASTMLKSAGPDGILVYDEPTGVLSRIDDNGNTTWDHTMTYLGQYNLVEDEKSRIYLFYLWGTVHVINERGVLISKFNPVITNDANLSYEPAVFNSTVYVIGDDKYPDSSVLYALNIDGTLKWKQQFNSSVSPTIYTGKGIVCVDTESRSGSQLDPMLYVMDDKGEHMYTYQSGDGSRWEQVYVDKNDTVYAKTYGGTLYAFRG
jgi:hypothetical protein